MEVVEQETLTLQLPKVEVPVTSDAVERTLHPESLLLAVVAVAAAPDSLEMVEHPTEGMEHRQRRTD